MFEPFRGSHSTYRVNYDEYCHARSLAREPTDISPGFSLIYASPAESEILTNEVETEYGFNGVLVNPKSQKLVLKCNFTGERTEVSEDRVRHWSSVEMLKR